MMSFHEIESVMVGRRFLKSNVDGVRLDMRDMEMREVWAFGIGPVVAWWCQVGAGDSI